MGSCAKTSFAALHVNSRLIRASFATVVLALATVAGVAHSQDAAKPESAAAPAAAEPEVATQSERRNDGHEGRRKDEAETPTSTPAPKTVPAADVAPATETVCRSVKVTGTRMPKRICATAEQWAAADAQGETGAKDTLRQINRPQPALQQSLGGPGVP